MLNMSALAWRHHTWMMLYCAKAGRSLQVAFALVYDQDTLWPGGSKLAELSDIVLAVEVAPDPVMPVGPEAYLAHLTVIEILTVLVAQRLGDKAIDRLANIQRTLETRGHDIQHHARIDWEDPANGSNGGKP